MKGERLEQYWQKYLSETPDALLGNGGYGVHELGDSCALADELSGLIRSGVKTATCSALWEWEAEGAELPQVGAKKLWWMGITIQFALLKL